MGLSDTLRRFAARRPQLLVVEGAGGTSERLAVERESRERGWPVADVPADADVLILVGAVETIGEYVDRVWDQLPGPRARVRLTAGDDVASAIQRSRSQLVDVAGQQADVRRTERPMPGMPGMPGTMDMSGHDMGDMDMSGHDMGNMDMGGHDMGGMDMEMPAGLGMADRALDRDGLKLDVLTVPWGPILPCWPDGLVVTTVLQGDVVQSATVERRGDDHARRAGWAGALAHLDPPLAAAVARLDALAQLLGVAGWAGARLRCQRVRDALLAGQDATAALHRLTRQVSRSPALARMTTGIATSRDEDVTARYRRWLIEARAGVHDGVLPPAEDDSDVLARLQDLVTGSEVATLRLVVAALGLALSGAESRSGADV